MNPIRPEEVTKSVKVPDFVIQAFNELITENWDGSTSRVTQDKAVNRIIQCFEKQKWENITRDTIFRNHWLDVEPIFREAGWDVKFDKPGYCESYEAYFIFSK